MKLVKKMIIKIIHSLGFDIIRIPKDFENIFLGLNQYPIHSVIDIGANRGQFAKKARRAFPDAHIYCFEPLQEPFKELQKWVADEGTGKITVFNLALGDKEGEANMFLHFDHNDSSSFLKTTKICEKIYPFTKKQVMTPVKLTTLDKVVEALSISLVPEILIKMDVEGYEDKVIQGGAKTLEKARVCLLEICLDSLHKNQPTFKKIFSLMDALNFRYAGNLDQVYDKDGHVIYINAVFLKAV